MNTEHHHRIPISLGEATAEIEAENERQRNETKPKKPVVSPNKPYRKSKHCGVYPK